ncbi:MoxR family ATPase [bacterium]|nr:MoxR family ATPase [bacterium]
MNTDVKQIQEQVQSASAKFSVLRQEISNTIVGQSYMIDRLLIGLLSNGHILLEGVPGLAKTLCVTTLAKAVKADFKRIQFTPDLLPADLIGTMIYDPKEGTFKTKKGPIFANLILADEINRAPAKVQSALLEAMQEHQVTIGDQSFALDEPFLVLATQNPIEQEGTYPLPEAQVDRFMLKLRITYPNKKEEKEIQRRMASTNVKCEVNQIITPQEILEARKIVDSIYIDEKVSDYILDIIFATREPEAYKLPFKDYIQYGASPRATIALTIAAKAHAFLQGRGFVTPQDVKSVGPDVLRHRVIVSYEAEAEGMTSDDLVQKIFDEVQVP